MINYSLKPFIVGEVFFATNNSLPNFQIDITTSEAIVFFSSDYYPCFMVHEDVKKDLLKSELTGFHFPNDNGTMEYTFKNKETFNEKETFPKWHWIIFSEDETKDIHINDQWEIICDERFIDILRKKRLNKKRADLKEISLKKVEKEEDKISPDYDPNSYYKKEKSFNWPVFGFIFIIALLVSLLLFL